MPNCNTQPLSNVGIPQIDMRSQYNNFPEIPQMSFNKDIEVEITPYHMIAKKTQSMPHRTSSVIIDVKQDGEAYCAYSHSYHNFLGYGDTKEKAVKSFCQSFEYDKKSEELSNYYYKVDY